MPSAESPVNPVDQPLPGLPGMLGIRVTHLDPSYVEATLTATESHRVPGESHVHAGAVVTLADTACGYGCRAALPGGANGFVTLEFKSNHVKAAMPGDRLVCVATPAHVGRRTQVWDAVVTVGTATRPIAMFRCTQLVL
ncbi:Acyl-coenzyme A thioesterase PaaI, contains HGG motif [Mycobacterium numidiamassiliense]|uniref:Acyl-coenzyme A thioesterase PaaI, contains HGG motif n=1 Tax=Mycobacterium numidiamassiliense TaxID=1841861 RepID=A0A2U3PHH7_9MYCO|nr:PaaI family thioesterase [Mycobacterium numidiamassiliense]SPM43216.1 Acyl-coenzyme A thioesterase PaaI, contains HGG motif [Mycobacterium numidiamassiliense]